ncbi:MAG: FtsX-like permease family protein, partial [Gemmatimonadetes bacterium]|nr:FtsX-like permease family protein [Gemmatimonadota bacterium]
VNETLARLFWPDRDPLGERFEGSGPGGSGAITVVGVVADVKRRTLDEQTAPEAYLPHTQAFWNADLYLTVRTEADPAALGGALRRQVWEVDPTLPVTRVEPLTTRISGSIALPRVRTLVLVGLAVAAALIALVGIYGVLSFVVAEREREMAVRMALGAARERVLAQVLRRGLALAAAGVALGMASGAVATRALRSFLFGVEPLDGVTFAATALLLLAAAAAASWVPARRAAGVDPMRALRGP